MPPLPPVRVMPDAVMPADERGVRVVCAACGQHEPLDDDRPMIEQLRQFRARHDHVDADRRLVPHG